MSDWVDASTDEYWGDSGLSYPEQSSFSYLGNGIWGGDGNAAALYEYYSSPLQWNNELEDYYTIYGIRFTVSFEFIWNENPYTDITVRVVTNQSRTITYPTTLRFYDQAPASHLVSIEYEPQIGERPVLIELVSDYFGSNYGNDPRLYGIQVLLPDAPPAALWRDYRNTSEAFSE